MHKHLVFLLLTFSCNKPPIDPQEAVEVKDFSEGLYSTILCEEDFETCGVQGFTEWGVPVLLISEKASDYFAPYGLLMWELPPKTMTRIWNSIEDYELEVAWIGVLPLEKRDVKLLTERIELRKERRVWIKRVTANFPNQPERWLKLPPKQKPQRKEAANVLFWNLDF